MKLIPAIDLKDNNCVRLKKGNEESAIIYSDNPVDQARFFENNGCERIHLVDLDAAFGRPQVNRDTIIKIRKSVKVPIQLGGGVRNKHDVNFYLDNGINYLVVGSMAVTNVSTVREIADEFKNTIYIAMDVRKNNQIMINGWVENSKLQSTDINKTYKDSSIKGYIITNIERDGMMNGPDEEFISSHLQLYNKPLIFSGGFSDYESLKFLAKKIKNLKTINQVEGVIIGKAFYSGTIKINQAMEILKKYA